MSASGIIVLLLIAAAMVIGATWTVGARNREDDE